MLRSVFLSCLLLASVLVTDATTKYTVKACLASSLSSTTCLSGSLKSVATTYLTQPVTGECEETVDQKGSVTTADLTLPSGSGQVLLVEVITAHSSHTSDSGFFVRPTRRTRSWGKPTLTSKSATFFLADTGQYSVEFASQASWRSEASLSFDSLMLFVNPPLSIPADTETISDDSTALAVDLGPNKKYVFANDMSYDWGGDKVFKVHDNTHVYFEPGAHVRARIVQTEKKVDNVLISGYGTLDAHYDLEPDLVGISDDNTHQTIGIYGKNIRVHGVTILNTNPKCGAWGYCLNINANWSPIGDPSDPFGADELQDQTTPAPSYKPRQAHCQLNNMDDSPNTDFSNCPTSHDDGQKVTFVKCLTWAMGQDGINAGKYGTVDNSFVRVIDDAIKPWDSYGVYTNVTIWQQALGWPINFGWWNWNQPDVNTEIEDIYVIHNHNWHTSGGWPESASGQCTIGGIYGSGAPKTGYKLKNIFVETAASCAVGLEISKSAYSRHPTVDGCVASISDMEIEGLFFDEPFKTGTGYNNFISGEASPYPACTGDLSGKVENVKISSSVAGAILSESDFTLPAPSTVPGLTFSAPTDPHPFPAYALHAGKNAYVGAGVSLEIEEDGEITVNALQCAARCQSDWSCDCVVYQKSDGRCWKRQGCVPTLFDDDSSYDTYVRDWTVPVREEEDDGAVVDGDDEGGEEDEDEDGAAAGFGLGAAALAGAGVVFAMLG
ncbi:hypothetical protein TeGR_g13029 [Tetraparma gracilis]|uniref:Apple domain-containing protein n=1 Tax=Tetraparma gracilis TaxID=2962635 RepID=A0ABQ6MYX0_9STRA|nr:hypothetical protein TeGR_g13029 [Tetraparma gracilis]